MEKRRVELATTAGSEIFEAEYPNALEQWFLKEEADVPPKDCVRMRVEALLADGATVQILQELHSWGKTIQNGFGEKGIKEADCIVAAVCEILKIDETSAAA